MFDSFAGRTDVRLPEGFSEAIDAPQFSIGDRCRWISTTSTDWGTVIGQVFAPLSPNKPDRPQWGWVYLVWLDADSPSRSWVVADWAEESALELLPADGN